MSKKKLQSSSPKKEGTEQGFRLTPPIIVSFVGVAIMALAVFATWQARRLGGPMVSPSDLGIMPILKVDQEKVDLGDVQLGQSVEVKFLLTNVGNEELRFTKAPYVEVKAGC